MDPNDKAVGSAGSITEFQTALDQFKSGLTPQQSQEFADRLGSQRRMRNMAKLAKFIEAMTQLGQVVEVFLNVDCTVAFVWAPIKFVLLAASTYVDSLDALLDTYAEIGEILPHLTRYRELLREHPELKKYIESYYCDVLDFHRNALKVFSRPAFHSSWKTFKTRFSPILNSLKRHRDLISDEKLSIAITEVRDLRMSVEDKLDALSRGMAELKIEEEEERVLRTRERNERKRQYVLGKLDPPDYQRDFERACGQRQPGSSEDWILEHSLVENWLHLAKSSTNHIYLHGIPGAGKTILTSRIVDHLNALRSINRIQGSSFSVVYFFFSHVQADKRDATSLFLAIIAQLIYQDEVLLDQVYEQCHLHDHHRIRSLDTIQLLATDALRSQHLCFLVLDGLDECIGSPATSSSSEQDKVIDWLEQLTSDHGDPRASTDQNHVRLFISGQRNGVLDQRLSSYPSIQLEQTSAHSKSIESYAQSRAVEISRKFQLCNEDQNEIVSQVTVRAEGMFLYAKIVLNNLMSQISKYYFRQEMKTENFPQGLNEAYERVVTRVLDMPIAAQKQVAKEILGLIICAERPLMWKEIQSKFCVNLDLESADVDLQLSSSCKYFCSSLVEVDSAAGQETDPDNKILLVHDTARMFVAATILRTFESDTDYVVNRYLFQSGRIRIAQEHAKMALFCSRYLSSAPFRKEIRGSDVRQLALTGYYGFQDYAAAFWWKHAIKVAAAAVDVNKQLLDETLEAVASAMKSYRTSQPPLNECERYSAKNTQHFLLHMTQDEWDWENQFKMQDRVQKIRTVVERLFENKSKEDLYGSLVPFYGVFRYKCSKPWCQWFSSGFDTLGARDDHVSEHERPFRCLIEACYGRDIGFATESELSRHEKRIHSVPVGLDFPTLRPSKAKAESLYMAIEKGDLAAIKSLTSAGVDVNTRQWTTGMSPLQLAVQKGRMDICQYLLENGADVNRSSLRSPRTALHVAVEADDADITHLLLCQPEIDPSAIDFNYQTPFDLGSMMGSRSALSAFITKWPSLKGVSLLPGSVMTNTDADTATTSSYSSLLFIKSLIKDPTSDLNAAHERLGQAPLFCLIQYNSVELVEALLSTGRVNQKDSSTLSAIHHAILTQNADMVSLISKQSSFNLLDETQDEASALIKVAEQSDDAVKAAIFDQDLPVWKDVSPLHLAACFCSVNLTREFLEAGLDPNARLSRFPPGWASGEQTFRETSHSLETPLGIAFFQAAISESKRSQYLQIARLLLGSGNIELASLSLEERTCLLAMLIVAVPSGGSAYKNLLAQMHRLGFSMPWAAVCCDENSRRLPYLDTPALWTKNPAVRNLRSLASLRNGDFLKVAKENYPLTKWIILFGGVKGGSLKLEEKEVDALLQLIVVRRDECFLLGLLKAGVKPNEAFLRAVRQGNVALVDLMLKTGRIMVNKAYQDGRTLMEIGLSEGNRWVVKRLREEQKSRRPRQ